MGELRGRTVLVTGAASGIGRCLALEFAQEGCDLILIDINPAGLQATAGEVRATGGSASCHAVDITDPAQVEALASRVEPHVLVNCAGTSVTAELEDTTMAEWRLIMGVNLFGAINMVQAFLPQLKAKPRTQIVNIASAFGLVSYPSMGAYCTSKFAMIGYTNALTRELARHDIRVTLICPGITRTPFLDTTDMKGYDGATKKQGLLRLLPLISADPRRLARYIVRAAKRERRMVVHTWIAKLVFYANRLSPAAISLSLDLVYRLVLFMRAREAGAPDEADEKFLEVVNE
ncbi:MAG: SDR family NAD(P)-dependent oxidoreductase [Candidatus Geothermincolia bacterium]